MGCCSTFAPNASMRYREYSMWGGGLSSVAAAAVQGPQFNPHLPFSLVPAGPWGGTGSSVGDESSFSKACSKDLDTFTSNNCFGSSELERINKRNVLEVHNLCCASAKGGCQHQPQGASAAAPTPVLLLLLQCAIHMRNSLPGGTAVASSSGGFERDEAYPSCIGLSAADRPVERTFPAVRRQKHREVQLSSSSSSSCLHAGGLPEDHSWEWDEG